MKNEKIQQMEEIMGNSVETLENSRKDIFQIYESARNRVIEIENKIKMINRKIKKITNEKNAKKDDLNQKKQYLKEKNKEKNKEENKEDNQKENIYGDKESLPRIYKNLLKISEETECLEKKEEKLKQRRRKLQEHLSEIKITAEKAEDIVSRVSLVKDYLKGELDNLSTHFEDRKKKNEMAMKVIQAQEEERKRVAREIHDGPAQSLANLNFRFELVSRMIDKDLEQARAEINDLKEIVNSSVSEVRKIIYDLRPMSLDDLGIVPTLKRYIDKFSRETEFTVDFKINGEQKSLDDYYQITIFRLIQEALNNIKNHAEAVRGEVLLEFKSNYISIIIKDDGKGFLLEDIDDGKFGLISMRERCEMLDGELIVDSSPGAGTVIEAVLPLKSIKE